MEAARAYKFRIYPDATRQAEIDERLVLAQQLYNKILEKSIHLNWLFLIPRDFDMSALNLSSVIFPVSKMGSLLLNYFLYEPVELRH